MATMATSWAPTSARTPLLRTNFSGERLRAGLSASTSPFPEAHFAGFPFRVSPQRLQVTALKRIKGKVVCSSNEKTVSVEVTRLSVHPKYKKRIRSTKKYHAHDEENRCQVGDFVTLVKCAPISKTKKFLIFDVVPKPEPKPNPYSDEELRRLLPKLPIIKR